MSFKKELAKDRFFESVRCSESIQEQLYFRQPESLSAAVRLQRQLESAHFASCNTVGPSSASRPMCSPSKPRVELNVMDGAETSLHAEIGELKQVLLKLDSRLAKLEGAPKVKRQVDMSNIKCFSCSQYGHFARNCPQQQLKEKGVPPRANPYS